MCKALLIIDMPDICNDCPCYAEDEEYMLCRITGESLARYHTDNYRPNWCPLIDIKDYKNHLDPLEYVTKKKVGGL